MSNTPNYNIATAKQLYFNGLALTDISSHLSIPLSVLRQEAFGESDDATSPTCWHALLQRYGATALDIETYSKYKPMVMKHAEANIMKKISQSAIELAEDEGSLDLAGIKTAVDIVEKIDKITRLEGGQATEHIGIDISALSMREIQEARRKITPFTIEAEYERSDEEDESEEDDQEATE